MDRIMIALLSLIAAGLSAAFFLYVSIVPILVIAGATLALVCAAGLALAGGRLGRWVEIIDEPERRRRATMRV